jgi:hypothetical protein
MSACGSAPKFTEAGQLLEPPLPDPEPPPAVEVPEPVAEPPAVVVTVATPPEVAAAEPLLAGAETPDEPAPTPPALLPRPAVLDEHAATDAATAASITNTRERRITETHLRRGGTRPPPPDTRAV